MKAAIRNISNKLTGNLIDIRAKHFTMVKSFNNYPF